MPRSVLLCLVLCLPSALGAPGGSTPCVALTTPAYDATARFRAVHIDTLDPRLEGVFEEAFRSRRFPIPRAAGCLICQAQPTPSTVEELDVALAQALARLGDE